MPPSTTTNTTTSTHAAKTVPTGEHLAENLTRRLVPAGHNLIFDCVCDNAVWGAWVEILHIVQLQLPRVSGPASQGSSGLSCPSPPFGGCHLLEQVLPGCLCASAQALLCGLLVPVLRLQQSHPSEQTAASPTNPSDHVSRTCSPVVTPVSISGSRMTSHLVTHAGLLIVHYSNPYASAWHRTVLPPS